MRFLVISIGNTNIRAAISGEPECGMRSDAVKSAEDFSRFLENAFGAEVLRAVDGSAVCSVVPGKTDAVMASVAFVTGKAPIRAGTPIKSRYGPGLGEDRAVCCAAALRRFKPPLVVVDMGTATTVNFVGADGVFEGGAIMAGVQTGLDALGSYTSLLPRENADGADGSFANRVPLIGRGTRECLLSGSLIGTALAVEGYVRRIGESVGRAPKVIVTGGHARAVLPYCGFEHEHLPGLLMDGLVEQLTVNNEQRTTKMG